MFAAARSGLLGFMPLFIVSGYCQEAGVTTPTSGSAAMPISLCRLKYRYSRTSHDEVGEDAASARRGTIAGPVQGRNTGLDAAAELAFLACW